MINNIISFFNRFYLYFVGSLKDIYSGSFLFVKVDKEKGNLINFNKVNIKHTVISVKGKGNKISSKKNLIEKTKIVINGDSNTCVLHENVKLRNANIIIRGNANIVEIGKSTTFGGVRIVNVGENNIVQIGEDCLFSDQIEIWASDTHSIYNSKNEKINPEKPIFIDNKVWIGSKVTILKGVKINEGAIVGMGTLVSKDVPKKTISVGVPNKVIKENVYWTNEF